MSQGKDANKILGRFHMERNKAIETHLARNWRKEDATSGEVVEATVYRKLVSSLMYLVNTQLDMCYIINHLSQAIIRPTKLYWKVENHLLKYLKGTSEYGLWYKWIEGGNYEGLTDAD